MGLLEKNHYTSHENANALDSSQPANNGDKWKQPRFPSRTNRAHSSHGVLLGSPTTLEKEKQAKISQLEIFSLFFSV